MNFPPPTSAMKNMAIKMPQESQGLPDRLSKRAEHGTVQSQVSKPVHHLQLQEEQRPIEGLRQELQMQSNAVGSATYAQRHYIELKAAAQIGRLGPLESSRLMFDTLLGTDETIEPSDYLSHADHDERIIHPYEMMRR